jgi:hypothetical protein
MSAASAIDVLTAALAYLLVKHAAADFFLQTAFQWRNKGDYGHPGGIVNVAIHAALTLPVFASALYFGRCGGTVGRGAGALPHRLVEGPPRQAPPLDGR